MSETTGKTRADDDDARIEELKQSVYHWHDTAQMLKRQRDIAEAERDDWRIRAMQSEQQRQALLAAYDALRKDAARYRLLRGLFRHAKWADVDALHELEPDGEKYIADDLLDAALDCVIDAAMEGKA